MDIYIYIIYIYTQETGKSKAITTTGTFFMIVVSIDD